MKRRTLALAGAAALAVGFTGLAGPAAADPGINSAPVGDVIISEVAAELDGTGTTSTEGGYVILRNTSSSPVNVGGWELNGCNTTTSFDINTLPSLTQIPANGELLFADANYSGSRPQNFPFDTTDVLDIAGGGVELLDASGALMHDVRWGTTHTDCVSFVPSGVSPSSIKSITYDSVNDVWAQTDPQ